MSDYNIDDAQLEAFDSEQKDVVINLFKDMHGNISEAVDTKVADALADAGRAVPTPAPRPGGPKVGAGMTHSSAISLPIAAR